MNLFVPASKVTEKSIAASVESNLSPCRQPFLYLTVALVTGVLVDRWIEPAPLYGAVIAVVSIAVAIKFVVSTKNAAATLALLASFAAMGALLSVCERVSPQDSRLKRLFDEQIITPDDAAELTGTLLVPPEPAPGWARARLCRSYRRCW